MKTTSMILGLLIIVLIMVWARAFYGSMKTYGQGERYLKQNQYIKAITFFDRSIHWYTPFNPYVKKSAERLWEIGAFAEHRRDFKLALIAYRTIRQGFYAASSFYTPGKNWIRKCDLKISELTELEEGAKKTQKGPLGDKKPEYQSKKVTSPNIFWTIILEIGFLGWIGSAIGFITFLLKDNRKLRSFISAAFKWGCVMLVFFVMWIIGMMKA